MTMRNLQIIKKTRGEKTASERKAGWGCRKEKEGQQAAADDSGALLAADCPLPRVDC